MTCFSCAWLNSVLSKQTVTADRTLGHRIRIPLMRILSSQFPDEYNALLRKFHAAVSAQRPSPTSGGSPSPVVVKRERVEELPVTAVAQGEPIKKLKVEPPAPVSLGVSNRAAQPLEPPPFAPLVGRIGPLGIMGWGAHPFFEGPRKRLYARGLLVELRDRERGHVIVRCVERGLFRAWRLGSPEPPELHAHLADAVRSVCPSEADARACFGDLQSRLQPALRMHFLGAAEDEEEVKAEDDGDGEASEMEPPRGGAVMRTSFSLEEDEALLATLDEACASGESGTSLLAPPCQVLRFPRQWIAYKCREDGALHGLLKRRTEDELVQRFEELESVVRTEIVNAYTQGVSRTGRLTDFAFLKRLPRETK